MRILAAVVVTACSSSHAVPVVSVAALPASPTTPVEETLLGDCRITGTGERTHRNVDAVEFDVFASPQVREPSLVIASPPAVAVAWSHFPSPLDHKRRAQVGLGGQKHVRFDGWSSLEGRTFTVQKRLFAEPGHLWARIGAPVAMLGAEGRVAVASVATPFLSPKTLMVRGACDGVSYQPDEPERSSPPERKSLAEGTSKSSTLPLFAAPEGKPFTTLTLDADSPLSFSVMERKDGFVRVLGEAEDIGFDAWVRASDVVEDAFGSIGLSGFGTSSCGGMMSAEHGIVARDTPLFVGKTPIALA
ncbi:MAG TPA: hypothetical protein VGH87_13880, partial [Polyangiaceae bacterium]